MIIDNIDNQNFGSILSPNKKILFSKSYRDDASIYYNIRFIDTNQAPIHIKGLDGKNITTEFSSDSNWLYILTSDRDNLLAYNVLENKLKHIKEFKGIEKIIPIHDQRVIVFAKNNDSLIMYRNYFFYTFWFP